MSPRGVVASLRGNVTARGLVRALRPAGRDALYVLLALYAVAWAFLWVRMGLRGDYVGFDFEGTLWDPGAAIRDGRSPYPPPVDSEVEIGNPALYPPLLMVLVSPLTLAPWSIGVVVWLGLLCVSVAGTLYLLGVRDPRCFVLALISAPTVSGLVWGNATLVLLPLVALAWRWRERWVQCGALVGIAIASKLFLWPLLFWLLGTRRYRASAIALLAACLGVAIPWAAIGFDGLTAYPELLRVAEQFYASHGYSVTTMLSALRVPTEQATLGSLAVGSTLALAALLFGRRGNDDVSVSIAILAAILGSPIVWEYYYTLLLIPLAVARPRFSGLWVLLVAFYVTHQLPRPHLEASDLVPGGSACCAPDGVPLSSWVFNHAPAGLWPALGHAALAVLVTALIWSSRPDSLPGRRVLGAS